MTGDLILFDPARTGSQSAKSGWITDANGCDIWQGGRFADGYAKVYIEKKPRRVYRVRYEQEIGPIPDELELDHFKCDNGPGGCCNPHHCRPVTHMENMMRSEAISSINRAKTHCPAGHELAGDNLAEWDRARGWRKCKICVAERTRAYAQRKGDELLTKRREDYRKTNGARAKKYYAAHADDIKRKAREQRATRKSVLKSTQSPGADAIV